MVSLIGFLFSTLPVGAAGEFEWMREFNLRAEADMAGFRARLAARFKIGETEINAVLSHGVKPADAYMLFRLGEMCGRPYEEVLERYKSEMGRGWGEFAKSLGIKPGSREFHALKQGSDLYDDAKGKGKVKEKGKSKPR